MVTFHNIMTSYMNEIKPNKTTLEMRRRCIHCDKTMHEALKTLMYGTVIWCDSLDSFV